MLFRSVVSGGALIKQGGGTLVLTGANTQSGLQIGGGQVIVSQPGALGAPGGQLVLNGGDLAFGQNMTVGQSLSVSGAGGGFDTAGHDVIMTGSVSGDACLIKTGAGHLSLNAAGGNAVGACVRQGQLSFNNVFNGRVWVDPTGMASGGGRVNGDVEVSGTLAPGNSPGRLEVAGNLVQNAGSTLSLDIDGLTPGVGAGHYDTLVISGTYTAGGQNPDPSEVVIDELVGQWIALWPLSLGLNHAGVDPWLFPWPGWLGAFLAFRLFDIWKPGPIGWADRQPGATGVMLDDLIAGVAAAVTVAVAAFIAHGVLGV